MRLLRRVLTLGVCLGVCSLAAAQTGGIQVSVLDGEGAPLAGASVVLANELGYVKTTEVLTDSNGRAGFPVLRAGDGYSVRISYPGFAPLGQDGIRVQIAETVRFPFQLFESIEDRVVVEAKRELIDLNTTETATRFTDTFVQDLPVPGRFYQAVLPLAPGVQDTNKDGNPNVHGSRARDFSAMVSGVRNVDPLTGQWMSRVNPNSIEAMEIITAGAGVEFGRAQGGFARILQKQGSNEHEGVVELYFRSDKLDGDGANNDSQLPNDGFDWYQGAFQLSGPLIRDKLWYRLSHEWRQFEEPVITGRGLEVATIEEATHSDQLTWQISPRNKLAFLFQSDPRDVDNFGVSSAISSDSAQRLKRDGEMYTVTWTAPFSPSILVESQLAWQDLNSGRLPSTSGISNDCINGGDLIVTAAYCTDVNQGLVSGSYHRSDEDHSQRFTMRSQATLYQNLGGKSHQFKLGLSVENERYFRDLTRNPELRVFFGNALIDQFDEGPLFTPFGRGLLGIAVPVEDSVRATGTNWAVYLEDQFKPLHNLTITGGVRIDREELNSEGREQFDPTGELEAFRGGLAFRAAFTGFEAPDDYVQQLQDYLCADVPITELGNCRTEVNQGTALEHQRNLHNARRPVDINITNTNFSPALSIAWSPGSSGKTAIKAAAGRHFNNIPLIIPLQELEPVVADLQYFIDPDTLFASVDSRIIPTLSTSTVDRNLRTPYQDEFTVAVEREIATETTLSVTYVNRRFRDQIQNVNINVATDDLGKCNRQNLVVGPLVPSPGMSDLDNPGSWIRDPFTGEMYPDTDPGAGDGRLDDCVGTIQALAVGGDNPFIFEARRPDGTPDLYIQNPFWGDILLIGNFNEIDYDAVVLELVRRQYRGWELQGSYTWSQAEGDGEDFFQEVGDDPSLRDDVFGYQSYDQRHVVKLIGTSVTPWGIRLGSAITWQSGLPYSVLFESRSFDTLPPETTNLSSVVARPRQEYVTGQRNDQRSPAFWNVDLRAAKEFTVGRTMNLQISAEVFNLLDDDTLSIYNLDLERGQRLNGVNETTRRFGRRWQLGAKLNF